MIYTFYAHGGPNAPNRKWNVECLDGEAIVGEFDSSANHLPCPSLYVCLFRRPVGVSGNFCWSATDCVTLILQ